METDSEQVGDELMGVPYNIMWDVYQEEDSDMEEGEGPPDEGEGPVSDEELSSEEELEELCTDPDTVRTL